MNRRLLLILILLLPVALSTWLLQQQKGRPLDGAERRSDQPDYFLRGIESLSTDPSGQLQHRLLADSLYHYPDRDAIEMQLPRIEIHQPDGSHWAIQAQHGLVTDQQREFFLRGEVHIRHLDTPHGLHLETDSLLLRSDTHYAETADPVRLTTPHSRLEGVGMELYAKQQRLTLLSSVRGIHHANQP